MSDSMPDNENKSDKTRFLIYIVGAAMALLGYFTKDMVSKIDKNVWDLYENVDENHQRSNDNAIEFYKNALEDCRNEKNHYRDQYHNCNDKRIDDQK